MALVTAGEKGEGAVAPPTLGEVALLVDAPVTAPGAMPVVVVGMINVGLGTSTRVSARLGCDTAGALPASAEVVASAHGGAGG